MSDRQLFRPEAVAFQLQRRAGGVAMLQPLPVGLLFWCLTVAFVLIVTFLVLAQYTRKETAVGHLAPAGDVLKAYLYVPPHAIGFVRVGQSVRIVYDGYPYQSFGAYGGRIAAVARTMLAPADVGHVSLREPAYKVTVELDRQGVTGLGERIPLQSDMPLKADIVLDRRSLLAWLIDPILERGPHDPAD